jgi:hypothetical protein
MLRIKTGAISVITSLLAFAVLTFAAVPQSINFQGYITDKTSGVPLNSNAVSMEFSLYSSTRPGSGAVWSETQSPVDVKNGIYSVQLGAASPNQAINAPFDVPYYLGVDVNNSGELPLQPLSSAPYALRANTADSLSGVQAVTLPSNGLAVGTNQLVASGGKVGIGTATPSEQLEITGNLKLPVTTATQGQIKNGSSTVLHTFGLYNIFAGRDAGNFTMAGNNNSAVGGMTLSHNESGSNNSAFGAYSLLMSATGANNTAIGTDALAMNSSGNNNTAIGKGAGMSLQSGSNNIYIGAGTTAATLDESNTIRIGNTQTETHIAGTLSAGGLGIIAVPCNDGEFLRFDARAATWRCNPVSGGFAATGPPVGFLTFNGVSTALDMSVFSFDLQLGGGSITQQQKTYSLSKLKVLVDPGRYAPALSMRIAAGIKHQTAGLWLLDSATQQYVQYVLLEGFVITGQTAVAPSRDRDTTLVEYTLIPEKVTFTSPLNTAQVAIADLVSGTISASGCSLTSTPVFTSTHGLPITMDAMFPGSYPISSYGSGITSAVTPNTGGSGGNATFTPVTVTGSTLTDGPCFMNALINQIFSEVAIYTASKASVSAGSTILESRTRLQSGHVTGYRLFSTLSGTLQHEITITPSSKIYWGYYPFNATIQQNDPVVETGWNLILNSQI